MKLKALIKSLISTKPTASKQPEQSEDDISRFQFSSVAADDIKKDIKAKYGHSSDLLEFFATNRKYSIHKWHHYIPIYDRYFSAFRGRKVRFLEIGVSKGGSLQMWRKYFGDDAVIFGIDIDPECKTLDGLAGQVRIGSQTDEQFLASVIQEMGGVDIILDDGSHHMDHISASLKFLYPHLSVGGIYMIEDLHTAYWKSFDGGYRTEKNVFGLIMEVVDDMHRWYHDEGVKQPAISQDCSGIHIHDSIVVLEKNRVYEPVHSLKV